MCASARRSVRFPIPPYRMRMSPVVTAVSFIRHAARNHTAQPTRTAKVIATMIGIGIFAFATKAGIVMEEQRQDLWKNNNTSCGECYLCGNLCDRVGNREERCQRSRKPDSSKKRHYASFVNVFLHAMHDDDVGRISRRFGSIPSPQYLQMP